MFALAGCTTLVPAPTASAAGSGTGGASRKAGAAGSGNGTGSGSGASGAAGMHVAMPAGLDAGPPPAAPPSCNQQVGSCPATSFAILQPLLDANDFGADARFVAMDGDAVLVAQGNGQFTVVTLDRPSMNPSPPGYVSWAFPSDELQPTAVTTGQPEQSAGQRYVFVLACDQERKQCGIFRGETRGPMLDPWPETELPVGFVPRGLVFDATSDPRALCVYGNGLLCFQNGWQQAIPSSAELRLNAVAIGPQWSLAVGDHGRWFKRDRAGLGALGPWQEQPALRDVTLTQASVEESGGVITGDGRLQAALGAQSELFCSPEAGLDAFLLIPGSRGLAYAVMRNGEFVRYASPTSTRPQSACSSQQLPGAGAVIQTGTAPCVVLNPRVLTDKVLLGTNLCVEVP
jgi:hypothetical protein